jgi:hypothetical protein
MPLERVIFWQQMAERQKRPGLAWADYTRSGLITPILPTMG